MIVMSRKAELLSIISKASDRYGNKLVELMTINGASNLQQITCEQAERYCIEHEILQTCAERCDETNG